jgi:carboxymethylenebutenolidase
VPQTTYEGLRADVSAAVEHLRTATGVTRTFTIGFCMGGRLAFLSDGFGLGLAGVVGFYGWPTGQSSNGTPAPADVAATFEAPVLGIFGGDDQGIDAASVGAFERALGAAGVEHRVVTYPGAPHSFFDRKQEAFEGVSALAWDEVLAFMGLEHGG